jgi:V/A-type H+-transporting ATPase subunit I
MISGNPIGFVFALVIYAVGHVFNLVLGLLSAYVHDCRLQYIEFYSKFYDGNGRLFKPFSLQTKYIDIKNGGNENG